MKQLIIGLGEIGQPLLSILQRTYGDFVRGYDVLYQQPYEDLIPYDILHICFPWGGLFPQEVTYYQNLSKAPLTVIHSTVPVGTTELIKNAVHSPVLGAHEHMEKDMQLYCKWVGGPRAIEAVNVFNLAGMRARAVESSRQTELMKLLCLAKYGINIAFSLFQKQLCDTEGFDPQDFTMWDFDYNLGVPANLRRPVIIPSDKYIGGHCVVPGVKLLNDLFPNDLLKGILAYEKPISASTGLPTGDFQVPRDDQQLGKPKAR